MKENNASRFGSSHRYLNNTINGGHVHFGDSYNYHGPDPQLQRDQQILESLRFRELYLRENQISDAHHNTFQWIFKEDIDPSIPWYITKPPWDSFIDWLKNGEKVYWVAGKPGSGKSTLMKFIASNPSTYKLLKAASVTVEPLILTFFFWKAGSKIQRSFLGCLASILHQLLDTVPAIITKLQDTNLKTERKRSVEDWSLVELQKALQFCLPLTQRTCCIFLDGLDEYDDGSDIAELVDFAVKLNELQNVKVCVSSRQEPEIKTLLASHPLLKLQDLTKADIWSLTQERLEKELKQAKFVDSDLNKNQQLVHDLVDKAEGVFLWVILAIKYLVTGLRKNDDIGTLQRRLSLLSPEMRTLYEQMWERLNEDKQLYREEAALYFYFAKERPVQLLFYTLAFNEKLRESCMSSVRLLDYQLLLEVKAACEIQAARIQSRCAGFLDLISDPYYELSSDELRARYEQVQPYRKYALMRRRSEGGTYDDYFQDVRGLCTCRNYPWPSSVMDRFNTYAQLCDIFVNRTVSLVHRTAMDFLTDTIEGRSICQIGAENQAKLLSNWVKAFGAAVHCGLYCAGASEWRELLSICYDADIQENELISLREDAERSMQRHSDQLTFFPSCVYGSNHWFYVEYQGLDADPVRLSGDLDYLGSMASINCLEPMMSYVRDAPKPISPFYKGYLLICAARSRTEAKNNGLVRKARKLKVLHSLLKCGADLLTPHAIPDYGMILIRSPIAQCLLSLLDIAIRQHLDASDPVIYDVVTALMNVQISEDFEVLIRVARESGGLNVDIAFGGQQSDFRPLFIAATAQSLRTLVSQVLRLPQKASHERWQFSSYARVVAVFSEDMEVIVMPNDEDSVRIIDSLQEDLVNAATHMSAEFNAFYTTLATKRVFQASYYFHEKEKELEQELENRFMSFLNDGKSPDGMYLVNPDPYEHVTMENWFERGELRDWHERRKRPRFQRKEEHRLPRRYPDDPSDGPRLHVWMAPS